MLYDLLCVRMSVPESDRRWRSSCRVWSEDRVRTEAQVTGALVTPRNSEKWPFLAVPIAAEPRWDPRNATMIDARARPFRVRLSRSHSVPLPKKGGLFIPS